MDKESAETLATIATVVSTAGQAVSLTRAGSAFSAAAKASRKAGEINAGQERAAGQRRAYFARREGRFAASRVVVMYPTPLIESQRLP